MPTLSKDLLTPSEYEQRDNTFFSTAKDNLKDKIEIEVGDSKQTDTFYPQYKIMRWDNEVNFSIRAETSPLAVVETEGDIIRYKTVDYDVEMYSKPEVSEDGGFEFEWVLHNVPKSNVLTATIQTKELDFFYQPELTQEEIERGAKRPENVIGSYAVYHKTKGGLNVSGGKEYKVGKAFHIYRPKVTDANGAETWGELYIDEQNGLLTVTIDQSWLNNAVYPVVVDPTLGYTTTGSSWSGGFYENVYAYQFTSTESGTVTAITSYWKTNGFTGYDIKQLIYLHNGGTHQVITNGEAPEVELSGSSGAWQPSTYSSSPTITNTDYCLGHCVNDSSGYVEFAYDSGTSALSSDNFKTNYYNLSPMGDPTIIDHNLLTGMIISIYATYTSIEQEGFAFGDDDDTEADHTLDTQDTNITSPLGTKTLRCIINAAGDPESKAYKLKYQKNGSGGYVDVPLA